MPVYQREVPYLPVRELDLTSANRKKRTRDDDMHVKSSHHHWSQLHYQKWTDLYPLNWLFFFEKLGECGKKMPSFHCRSLCLQLHSKSNSDIFSATATRTFIEKYLAYGYIKLLATCEKVQIRVEEMVKSVETDTRAQSNCKNSIHLEPVQHRK